VICKCGHVDLSPTITGVYTLPGKDGEPETYFGAGYTCKGCGTDGMVLWRDTTQEQRRAALDAEDAVRPKSPEMMMARQ
jgi:hypothetical protein